MSSERQIWAQTAATLADGAATLQVAKALRAFDALDAAAAGLNPLKIAVAASFTFEPLIKPLAARGYFDRFRLNIYNGPYGQHVQELMNPASGLARHDADALLVAVRLEDACPDLYERFAALSASRIASITASWKAEFESALLGFRQRSKARVLCTNYCLPAFPSLGLADVSSNPSQIGTILELNAWLSDLATRVGNMHVIDIDGVAARCGRERWTDPRMRLLARVPIAAEFHWEFASAIVRVLRAVSGASKKVLALDADNTLWGGVLGDVGRDGVQLGHDYPGNAYVAFQRRALELFHRGVVLVVASKNERANVLDVFENHAEMVLRPEHIAHFAVNWEPKPENLRRAAAALNLGLDSFVFVDDHPVECAMMRELAPEVLTIQLPEDPALHERALARLDCFDQLTLSEEDRRRGAMYREEAARAELRASVPDLESFYRSLDMTLQLARNDPGQLARIAQLTQRTNQFNMTTIRRTESDVAVLMERGDADVVTMRLTDRFGDNGIVGLAIVERRGDEHVFDSFMMSCRVLGRTVEQTFMGWLGRAAQAAGAKRLVGRYIRTKKNEPFGRFFESWGMVRDGSEADGAERWVFLLRPDSPQLALPDWMRIETNI